MKKGNIYTGKVIRTDFPAKGIVEVEGNGPEGGAIKSRFVVKNALLGQKVSFAVIKPRKGRAEGRLLRVEEPSPLETGSPCPHFGSCGGCTYLSLPYEEQLKLKEAQMRRLFEGCGKIGPDSEGEENGAAIRPGRKGLDLLSVFEGIKGSPVAYEYRNKMEFSFGDEVKDGPLSLGMHKRGSFYDVVTTQHCRLVDEDYRSILMVTLAYFQEKGLPYYHRLRHQGYLRHLLVRKASATGEILAALVTSSQWGKGAFRADEPASPGGECPVLPGEEGFLLEGWKEKLLSLKLKGSFAGILHMVNDSVADVVKSDRTEILYGRGFFVEELLGLKFTISPFSFFQTNSAGAGALYETVREYIGDLGGSLARDKVVFDLYSGTGTIAQLMAPVAKKVVGVELAEEAVEAAGKNAALNGLTNCEFIAGDVLKVLEALEMPDKPEEKPDVIILDPPRDGVHPKALKKLGATIRATRMLYISCNPASLVRDLEKMQEYGYVVERMCCVDMFPGTQHVETVCLLSKLNTKQHIEVELNLDELDLTSAESKATYDELKAYVLEKYGLKVSSLYISQVKRKCGLEVGQNYNLSKKDNAKVPQCPPEKEAAIMEALKYFRMI